MFIKTGLIIRLLFGTLYCSSAVQSNIEQYAYLTQDSISLTEDAIEWNGSTATLEDIEGYIKSSYSLKVGAYNPEFSRLMAILKIVNDTGIDDRLITLGFYGEDGIHEDAGVDDLFAPKKEKRKSSPQTVLVLEENGQLLLSDQPIETAGLAELVSGKEEINFYCINSYQFSRVYEVLNSLHTPSRPRVHFMVDQRTMVRVEAEVVHILDDGTEKKLSSPYITTKPGNVASLGVRDQQPQSQKDLYQQNGRTGGGNAFKVHPQVIGDFIKISGSISMKRVKGSAAFELEDKAIRNYTTETTVIPFAYVFDKNTESVKFDPIEIDGTKLVLSLTIFQVSGQGKKISNTAQ